MSDIIYLMLQNGDSAQYVCLFDDPKRQYQNIGFS